MLQNGYHCLFVCSCTSFLKIELRLARSIHALISSSSQSPLVLSHPSSISANLSVTTHSSFVLTGYVEMDLDHAIQAPHLFQHPLSLGLGKYSTREICATGFAEMVDSIWDLCNPKRDTPQMLLENLDAKGFTLTEVEIKKITGSEQLMVCDNVFKRIQLVIHNTLAFS
jgi:hypothetical protein